jgi:hypothetical protein
MRFFVLEGWELKKMKEFEDRKGLTMICPKCQTENREGAQFCVVCGQS